jgi:hypothetical protein
MTNSNQVEDSRIGEAQRAAAERGLLARIETLSFEGLVSFIFFDDREVTLAALKALVEDWSSYLALKETILLWPQMPAPIRAKNIRAELYALRDGSDPQSPRNHALRRLLEVIAPDLASEESDGGGAVMAVDEHQIRRMRRKYRPFEF